MLPDQPPVARNEPCPCGSGRRYKQCHGALAGGPSPPPAAATPEALTRQGIDAHRRGDLDAAERGYRAALAAAPDLAPALHYLGVVLYQRQRLAEALPLLERAVAQMPHEPEFHNNLGLALAAAQRDAEAIAAYGRALALKPDHAGALSNLGLALQATGDVDGAVAAYRRGLASTPDLPQLHWNLALALLLRGDYAEGWREYEWRLRAPETAAQLRAYAGPAWTGDARSGQTVLLHAEQGLGDALMNLRFARHVAERGARVVVAVPDTLLRLAATAPGVAATAPIAGPLPAYDAHASLMSLPGVLGITPRSVTVPVPYLRTDDALRRAALADVAREGGDALKVGIAWSGAPGNSLNARRSFALRDAARLLACPGVRWFSLKRHGEALAPDDAEAAARLVQLPLSDDFDGLAALVDALDVVVSVDTSLAHLAGALGKPVWVLLSRVPDWRWFLDRPDSPWYPTARLFRQRRHGDWSQPLAAVADALAGLVARR
ncbi:MAG: tetratricopeptide repeat protein [Burkholderiales bacterium]|nr:tetratricopeptide repeat protein [Burkholderiales bacterium]